MRDTKRGRALVRRTPMASPELVAKTTVPSDVSAAGPAERPSEVTWPRSSPAASKKTTSPRAVTTASVPSAAASAG